MSVLKITVTENHIKLVKQLRWSLKNGSVVGEGHDGDDFIPPFGENNLYEAIDSILNGRPADFNPFEAEDEVVYTDEQKAEWDQLYSELPLVLDIILYTGSFELGTYKTKFHDRVWKKLNN